MRETETAGVTRRGFQAGIGVSAMAVSLTRELSPRKERGIVPTLVDAAARATISVQPIRRNITVLQGSGGNIAVLTGPDGKLLVDAGFAVSRPAITRALHSINNDPVRHLINSHWHFDHTDGNAWLHAAGAAITAHENTRRHLCGATRVEGWQYTFPPAPPAALPARVFAEHLEMELNDTHLALKYYSPAHTDCDTSIYFTEADVLHVGDTWWNGVYPFIDYSTGGSVSGAIRAAEMNLALITNETIVIPGHGPVGRKPDLRAYRDMLVGVRDTVAALKKQGRSLKETVSVRPTAAWDGKWGQSLITPGAFTGLIYRGV